MDTNASVSELVGADWVRQEHDQGRAAVRRDRRHGPSVATRTDRSGPIAHDEGVSSTEAEPDGKGGYRKSHDPQADHPTDLTHPDPTGWSGVDLPLVRRREPR